MQTSLTVAWPAPGGAFQEQSHTCKLFVVHFKSRSIPGEEEITAHVHITQNTVNNLDAR
jgi:hypothetical protein